jgi:hypothetical protein
MAPGKFKMHSVIAGADIGVFTKEDFARGIPVSFSAGVEILEVAAVLRS